MKHRRNQREPRPAAPKPDPQGSLAPSAPPAPPPAASNSRGRWGFRLAALTVIPAMLLGGLELALRLAGAGFSPGFFLRARIEGQPFEIENARYGWQFFPPRLARAPGTLRFPAVKPPDTCRIFVLGESAAFGDPEPAYGFARYLDALLSRRYPRLQFEVVNVAMTAINSHVVRDIARQCAARQGDLWIVYMGNNEVVGPFGAGTVFGRPAAGRVFIRLQLALGRTRTGQALRALWQRLASPAGAPDQWGGMEMFLEQKVPADDPRLRRVYRHFAANLEDIIRFGRRARAGVLVGTVAVNLRDCPPFASTNRSSLDADARAQWQRLFSQGDEAAQSRDWVRAESAFRQAAALDDGHADLHFRWAQSLLSLDRAAEADARFERACDLDLLRFRADGPINDLIRQTVLRAGTNTSLRLVDAQGQFAARASEGFTGRAGFFEHVHLTAAGNYALARLFADASDPFLRERFPRHTGELQSWPTEEECHRVLARTGWAQAGILEELHRRLQLPPFTFQTGHAGRFQALAMELEQARAGLTEAALGEALARLQAALADRPQDLFIRQMLARLLQQTGDSASAIAQWRILASQYPHSIDAWYQLGNALDRAGQGSEAIASFQRAVSLDRDNAESFNGLGLALAGQRRWPEAIRAYERALELKPRFAGAHVNLGLALAESGRPGEARAHYQTAISLKPENPAAFVNLGKLLNREGKISDAIATYLEGIRAFPDDALAHMNLGNAYRALGRLDDARRSYEEALRLNPNLPEAHFQVGYDHSRLGDDANAIARFQEAVRLNPRFAEAHLNLGVAFARQQRFADAIVHFQRALEIQPDYESARRYLDLARRRIGSSGSDLPVPPPRTRPD